MEDRLPFHSWNLPFHSILGSSIFYTEIFISFHFPFRFIFQSVPFSIPFHFPFRSIFYSNEELVVQNLRREPHSSIMVRRFRKLKSCCYVIAIPSGWHRCPNPNCNARFWSKKTWLHTSPSKFLRTVSHVHNPSANLTQMPRVES